MYSGPHLLAVVLHALAQAGHELVPAIPHYAEDGEHVVGWAEAAGWDVALGGFSKGVRSGWGQWEGEGRGEGGSGGYGVLCIGLLRSPRLGGGLEAWRRGGGGEVTWKKW